MTARNSLVEHSAGSWNGVSDLSSGNQSLRSGRVDRYFDHGKSPAKPQHDAVRYHILRIRFAQEINMEARRDRRHVGSPVSENSRPSGSIGHGHESGAGDRASGTNVGSRHRKTEAHIAVL